MSDFKAKLRQICFPLGQQRTSMVQEVGSL